MLGWTSSSPRGGRGSPPGTAPRRLHWRWWTDWPQALPRPCASGGFLRPPGPCSAGRWRGGGKGKFPHHHPPRQPPRGEGGAGGRPPRPATRHRGAAGGGQGVMEIDVITIFPEMFQGFLQVGLLGQLREKELVRVGVHDLRQFARDRHRTVDDYPFGGGPGMVFKPEPLLEAVEALT